MKWAHALLVGCKLVSSGSNMDHVAVDFNNEDYDDDYDDNILHDEPEQLIEWDEEHRQKKIESYVFRGEVVGGIFENDYQLDEFLFKYYRGVLNQTAWLSNEEQIRQEDILLCASGRDPLGRKVRCPLGSYEEGSGSSPSSAATIPGPLLRRRTTTKIKFQTPARKYKQLKIMILWLQKLQKFGRYCYYGCHCLPEGNHNLRGGGYGEPVDMIDRSCKSFFQCYDCARLGNSQIEPDDKCIGESTKFKYKLSRNLITGEKSISCLDKINTCSRRICECDKRMAENLARWEDDWNPNFHTKLGDGRWIYVGQCLKLGTGKYGKPEECCGNTFPDLIPMQQGKQCCGHRPYDPFGQRKCCDGSKLRNEC